jgi:hypothetical protein
VLLSSVSTPTAIVIVSGLIGLASPPVNLSTRPLWRVLVGPENLRTAYALDTTMSSSTIVAGPVLATAVAIQISGSAALWATATLMAIGGIAIIQMPASRNWKPEPQQGNSMMLLRNKQFQILAFEGMIFGLAWGLTRNFDSIFFNFARYAWTFGAAARNSCWYQHYWWSINRQQEILNDSSARFQMGKPWCINCCYSFSVY